MLEAMHLDGDVGEPRNAVETRARILRVAPAAIPTPKLIAET